MARHLFRREEKRDSPLYVYLKPSERRLIDEIARASGQSASTMCRGILLEHAKTHTEITAGGESEDRRADSQRTQGF
jgi:hypothetical protein